MESSSIFMGASVVGLDTPTPPRFPVLHPGTLPNMDDRFPTWDRTDAHGREPETPTVRDPR